MLWLTEQPLNHLDLSQKAEKRSTLELGVALTEERELTFLLDVVLGACRLCDVNGASDFLNSDSEISFISFTFSEP